MHGEQTISEPIVSSGAFKKRKGEQKNERKKTKEQKHKHKTNGLRLQTRRAHAKNEFTHCLDHRESLWISSYTIDSRERVIRNSICSESNTRTRLCMCNVVCVVECVFLYTRIRYEQKCDVYVKFHESFQIDLWFDWVTFFLVQFSMFRQKAKACKKDNQQRLLWNRKFFDLERRIETKSSFSLIEIRKDSVH